jgi:hypothetical protein
LQLQRCHELGEDDLKGNRVGSGPRQASVATGAPHRIPLDGTTWSVWRDVGLRGAGFPADMVLASPYATNRSRVLRI